MKQIADFLKKNGFYVGLLCCVAIAITAGFVIQSEIEPVPQNTDEAPVQAFITEPVIATPDVAQSTEPIDNTAAAPLPVITPAPDIGPDIAATNAQALPALGMPVEGKVSRTFSLSPVFFESMADWRSHTAIDIAAEIGSDVTASADGVVLSVTVDPLFGHTVVIDHGNMKTYYSNLYKDILVNPGQDVRCGDPIGHIGTSSLTEGSEDAHLHFAVQVGEKYCDPSEYLK